MLAGAGFEFLRWWGVLDVVLRKPAIATSEIDFDVCAGVDLCGGVYPGDGICQPG